MAIKDRHGGGSLCIEFIPNDPRNPMEFSLAKKWTLTVLLAVATLAVVFVSSAYTGGCEADTRAIQLWHRGGNIRGEPIYVGVCNWAAAMVRIWAMRMRN